MNQFESQQQTLIQQKLKKKWSWKKISLFAGAGAMVVTSAGLVAWGVTKSYPTTNDERGLNIPSPLSSLKPLNTKQFENLYDNFAGIENFFIKSLSTKQLMFYLPSSTFKNLKGQIPLPTQSLKINLTPNLETILKEKFINTVSSNLRVLGLTSGFYFNEKLTELKFEKLELKGNKIIFETSLGYQNSEKFFELKGEINDSENKTWPISEFTQDNLAIIFEQANELFKSQINRNGYLIGLNFYGKKNANKSWASDQIIKLQEFNIQTWDYVLNSLKNFNLVQENVFIDAHELFKISGWDKANIYVTDKNAVHVDEIRNQVQIGQVNDFGNHSIVSKIKVSFKADKNINFEFWGSYLQNDQWGNY